MSKSVQVFLALQTSFHAVSQEPRLFPSSGSSLLHALGRILSFHPQLGKEKERSHRGCYGPNLGRAHITSAHIHWPQSGHMTIPICKRAGRCSLRVQQGKERKFGETPGNLRTSYFPSSHSLPSSIEQFHCCWLSTEKAKQKVWVYGLELEWITSAIFFLVFVYSESI